MSEQHTMFNRADHANRGRDWENELGTTHDFYRMKGLADIVKNPHEFVFITDRQYQEKSQRFHASMFAKSNGRWLIRSRSDVDFSGGGKGFSICFDAKLCSDRIFPIANIETHQIIRLKQSAKCGCIAGFMIKMGSVNRVFFMPIGYVDDRWIKLQIQTGRRAKPGTASLSIADMEQNGIEIPRDVNGLWNWFKVLVR